MSSIKDEPTEGETCLNAESPLNTHPSLSINEPTTQSTVKCEWPLKGVCACADGQCEDCQATTEKENDEKDNILTTTPAAVSPLNRQDSYETEFHPPNWEDYEAAENTGNASDAAREDVNPAFGPVDDTLADGPIIEEVNPEEIKEEITDNTEMEIASKEAEMQVEASQVAVHVDSDSPLDAFRGSTRSRERFTVNVPAVEEVIVKSEEEGTLSSLELPIIEQVSPPEVQSNEQASPTHDENRNVNKEIKEEEEGPMIEEVNPDDYPLSPRDGNTGQEAEIAVEANQVTVDAFPGTTDNESNVFEPADDNEDADDPIIEEVNPDEEIMEEIPDHVGEEANEEMEVEEDVQAEAIALSSLSLRRSTRVRKSTVNYALLPEAEEETVQDDPNTGTSDSEESDSDESETDNDSEMETDATNETEESNPITAGSSSDGRHSRKVFPCQFCGKELTTKANAQRHEGTHQSERPRPYLCSQSDCGKAFLSKAELEAHTIIHSGLRPFACATCGAAFNLKSNLKAHQRTHTDERPYTCKVCLMAFKRKQALVTHRLLHSGSKPSFTCVDCGSSFTQKGTLDRHRKGKIPCARRFTPSKSRPFSCTVAGCGKAFKDRKALKIHIRTHSGVKAFKCTVCGGAFGRKSTLKRHSRQFHGI